MSEREFVLTYVAVPLAVALGWLLWRSRFFLRSALLYLLAVTALVGLIRAGDGVQQAWRWGRAHWPATGAAEPAAPACIDRAPAADAPRDACWI